MDLGHPRLLVALGAHVKSKCLQAPVVPPNNTARPELDVAFGQLLLGFITDDDGFQLSAGQRCRNLSTEPCNFLTPLVLHDDDGKPSALFLGHGDVLSLLSAVSECCTSLGSQAPAFQVFPGHHLQVPM